LLVSVAFTVGELRHKGSLMDKRKIGHYLALIGCYCIYKMWLLIGFICLAYIVNRDEDSIPILIIIIVSTFFVTSSIMIFYLMLQQAGVHIKALKESNRLNK